MTRSIVARVAIGAPAEVVFAAATDWPGQREWIFATTTRATRGEGRAVGDEIVGRTSIGPLGFNDPMTITRWDPPRACTVLHTGRVVRGTATFAVEPDGDQRSWFVWSEEVDPPLGALGRVGFAAVSPVFAFFLRRSLDKFAVWVLQR